MNIFKWISWKLARRKVVRDAIKTAKQEQEDMLYHIMYVGDDTTGLEGFFTRKDSK